MQPNSPLEIFYEDDSIIVCKKPAGAPTQSKSTRTLDMESLIKRHLYQQATIKKEPYLGIIHRLDQPVSGILVFAKTPLAAKNLNLQLQSHNFGKYYSALLSHAPSSQYIGKPLIHYMKKNGQTNTSSICAPDDKSGKKAVLQLETLLATDAVADTFSLFKHCNIADTTTVTPVRIELETGRHHQIRVQMAHIGCPIWGDTKYGSSTSDQWQHIALCAYKLEFQHPITKKNLTFNLL